MSLATKRILKRPFWDTIHVGCGCQCTFLPCVCLILRITRLLLIHSLVAKWTELGRMKLLLHWRHSRYLSPDGVWTADHSRLHHRGVLNQRALHLKGPDAVPGERGGTALHHRPEAPLARDGPLAVADVPTRRL